MCIRPLKPSAVLKNFKPGRGDLVRIMVATAVACLSIAGLSAVADAQAAIRRFTNIPAQELGSALNTFAKERKLSLVYISEEIESRKTAGAVGELTAEEALRRLLDGTGLTYRYLNDETVTIVPVPTKPAAPVRSGKSYSQATIRVAQAANAQGSASDQ